MLNERAIVESLTRQELLTLVAQFDVSVADRRVRANLVDALCASRKARLELILAELSLATLKTLCRKHGLPELGRAKAALVERLCAAVKSGSRKAAAAKSSRTQAAAESARVRRAQKKVAPQATPTRGHTAAEAKPVRGRGKKAVAAKTAASRQGTTAASHTAARSRNGPGAKDAPLSLANVSSRPAAADDRASTAASARAKGAKIAAPQPESTASAAAASTSRVQQPPPRVASPAGNRPAAAVTTPGVFKTPNGQSAPVSGVEPAKPPAAPAPTARGNPLDNVIALPASKGGPPRPSPTVYRQPLPVEPNLFAPTMAVKKCQACKAKIELRKCGVQRCNTMIQVNPSRKICAECLFERNTLSMTEFNERLVEESKCPHCGEVWQRAS